MPDKDAWVIRDVDEETRRKIKRFAVDNGLTIATALRLLVETALTKLDTITVTQENLARAQWVKLSPEVLEAMREEIRRQLKEQESE